MGIGSVSAAHMNTPTSSVNASYDAAMLGKIKEQMEQQGEAAIGLIESASPAPSTPPPGTGGFVNDVA